VGGDGGRGCCVDGDVREVATEEVGEVEVKVEVVVVELKKYLFNIKKIF
jgi:hypothetical protein